MLFTNTLHTSEIRRPSRRRDCSGCSRYLKSSTYPKFIPLEAHAPTQHLILRALPYIRVGRVYYLKLDLT